jgi:hypothetical protein
MPLTDARWKFQHWKKQATASKLHVGTVAN